MNNDDSDFILPVIVLDANYNLLSRKGASFDFTIYDSCGPLTLENRLYMSLQPPAFKRRLFVMPSDVYDVRLECEAIVAIDATVETTLLPSCSHSSGRLCTTTASQDEAIVVCAKSF